MEVQTMTDIGWTFSGQPFLRWPPWVQEACELGRMEDMVVPRLRGQVVYPGERLILTEYGEIEHEMISS
jgi:hypothetical protein